MLFLLLLGIIATEGELTWATLQSGAPIVDGEKIYAALNPLDTDVSISTVL